MSFPAAWLERIESAGLLAESVEPGPALDCSEKEFQAAVVKLAKAKGWLAYHTHDSRRSEKGFPDLVLIRDGKLLIVELKTESGRVSPEQTVWLCALVACGVDVRTWRPSMWESIAETLKGG